MSDILCIVSYGKPNAEKVHVKARQECESC